MIGVGWYEEPPTADAVGLPAVFLAGPTTDGKPSGRARVGDFACGSLAPAELQALVMSAWRAELTAELIARRWRGVLWVPEFRDKGRGPDWFEARARAVFSGRSGAILDWEEARMSECHTVAAWLDVQARQPGLGLNARPEIYGLLLRFQSRGRVPGMWAPRRLAVGIPLTAKAVGRHRLEADRAGLDVSFTVQELAEEIIYLTAEGCKL